MTKSVRTNAISVGATGNPFARYFVASGQGGGWLIFREGLRQAVHKVKGKRQAMDVARIMARTHAPSQVMVEEADGRFSLKYDFAHAVEHGRG